jgi:hypothetical protein
MDSDDVAYRKSVRNMSIILVVAVITILVALIVPPYISPAHNTFQKQVSVVSPYGFTLGLELNATSLTTTGHVAITAWVNNTSSIIENVTAQDSWAVDRTRLWGRICTNGWPMGVGVMQGHYTVFNYTQGTLIRIPQPFVLCPVLRAAPEWYAFAPSSSKALVSLNGAPQFWVVQTTLAFGPASLGESQIPSGVYTAVAADEWGDVLLTNFLVS